MITSNRSKTTTAPFLTIIALVASTWSAQALSQTEPPPPSAPKGNQCAALFRPVVTTSPSGESAISFHSEIGIVSANGTPFQNPLSAAVRKLGPAESIVIANNVTIFSMAQVDAILKKSKEELPDDRRGFYERLKEGGNQRVVIQPRSYKILDELYETMPNFKPALDQIKRSLAISVAAGEPVRLPPILLLGDPGLGKTYFAKKVAEALGTGFELISMGSLTAGWILSGSSYQWKDSSMGKVAKALLEKEGANPVIVLDEIDKTSPNAQYDPLASIYTLWERDTAKKFRDEHIDGVDFDASHINWIATANYVDRIPEPIRSRAIVVTIKAPNRMQLEIIAKNVLKNELGEHPNLKFSSEISQDVFEILSKQSPREIRKLLTSAIGSAIINGRSFVRPEDIDLSVVEAERTSRPMGFTP